MQRLIALFALAMTALMLPGGALAQDYPTTRTISTERWVERWDHASQSWVRVNDDPAEALAKGKVVSVTTTQIVNGTVVKETQAAPPVGSHSRFALPISGPVAAPQIGASIAQYGPFRVLDGKRAAIVDSTDQASPAWFDAMLRDFPGLEVLEMIEAPGTRHDIANLQVGRQIRAAGLRTHVPVGGSVRSGAVELFLAGTTRTMDDSATFAVHSWLDNYGRQPGDFAEDHPANRLYLDYYAEMGMSETQAREFYAMTNSVPHASALWLGADDMRPWVRADHRVAATRRMLAGAERELPVQVIAEGPIAVPMSQHAAMVAIAAPVAVPSIAPSIAYDDLNAVTLAHSGMTLLDS